MDSAWASTLVIGVAIGLVGTVLYGLISRRASQENGPDIANASIAALGAPIMLGLGIAMARGGVTYPGAASMLGGVAASIYAAYLIVRIRSRNKNHPESE